MAQEVIPAKDTRLSRYNSARFGMRSEAVLLPWENREEYESLLAGMVDHYNPEGPLELHMVTELASIVWRKQRILLAESALYRKELAGEVSEFNARSMVKAAVIGKAPTDLQVGNVSLAETMGPEEERQRMGYAQTALDRARKLRDKVAKESDYAKAFALLGKDLQAKYEEMLGKEEADYQGIEEGSVFTYEKSVADIVFFMDVRLIPGLEALTVQHRYAEDIAAQLKGQSFNPEKLELISRYETALDRKLERILGMLLKTQEIRMGRRV